MHAAPAPATQPPQQRLPQLTTITVTPTATATASPSWLLGRCSTSLCKFAICIRHTSRFFPFSFFRPQDSLATGLLHCVLCPLLCHVTPPKLPISRRPLDALVRGLLIPGPLLAARRASSIEHSSRADSRPQRALSLLTLHRQSRPVCVLHRSTYYAPAPHRTLVAVSQSRATIWPASSATDVPSSLTSLSKLSKWTSTPRPTCLSLAPASCNRCPANCQLPTALPASPRGIARASPAFSLLSVSLSATLLLASLALLLVLLDARSAPTARTPWIWCVYRGARRGQTTMTAPEDQDAAGRTRMLFLLQRQTCPGTMSLPRHDGQDRSGREAAIGIGIGTATGTAARTMRCYSGLRTLGLHRLPILLLAHTTMAPTPGGTNPRTHRILSPPP